MKTHRILIALALAALLAACGNPDTEISTLSLTVPDVAHGDVQVVDLYRNASLEHLANSRHEAVAFSWAIPQNRVLAPRPETHRSVSRSFIIRTTAAGLRQGVDLPLTAPGAVMKISSEHGLMITPDKLVLTDPVGHVYRNNTAMDTVVSGAKLREAGMMVDLGTQAMKLRADLPTGVQKLRLSEDVAANLEGEIVIQVLEKQTATTLALQAAKSNYLRGERLHAKLEWTNADGVAVARVRSSSAWVTYPNGRVVPVTVANDGTVSLTLDEVQNLTPGALVEIHADAEVELANGQVVHRTVKTAAAYALPTARLNPSVKALDLASPTIRVGMSVEVGSAGRYAVTGTLYGTDSAGHRVPCMVGQSAKWLEPGTRQIELSFDRAKLPADADVSAPFELRDVRLADQSRMGVLHVQAKGVLLR